jgi:magnesium-transporting ATPase (P-type)
MLVFFASKGQCYVETAQLDGETNLKVKVTPRGLIISNDASCFETQFKVDIEGPNPYLYKFNGSWEREAQKISLEQANLLLRGTVLRNTQSIIGLVVYTGHQTKIMLNSHNPRGKSTNL